MWHRRTFLASVSLTVAGLALVPMDAHADDITKPAGVFVQSIADRVIAILKNKAIDKDERVRQLAAVFLDGFDVRAIGVFVLGRYGRNLPDATRNDYLSVFKDYVVETYAVRFNSYAGEQFSVTKQTVDGDDGAWVFSDIGQHGEDPVEVQWRVRKTSAGLKIIDVVVEGVSLVVTQRSEFASVLQHNDGNVEALTHLLHDKIVQLKQKV